MAAPALLSTKLYCPTPRQGLTVRPRLFARLEEGLRPGCRLLLICAPAGYGKTVLVTDWLADHRGSSALATAWLSLDDGDNDPVRFLTYLVAALQTIQPDLGNDLLSLLTLPHLPPMPALLTGLINDLNALPPTPTLVILDDFHVLTNPILFDALEFLLDHLPGHVHLVLTTRADPPLPLARMRVRGEVVELRAADLRFTMDEIQAFFEPGFPQVVDPQVLEAIEKRTEGWAAGLQLAALALRETGENAEAVQSFVETFSGSHRFVIDYLVDEVLARQAPAVRDFLLRTAILERFNADLSATLCDPALCRAFSGDPSSALTSGECQRLIESLDRANLFLVPLDAARGWFRYHHLFADVLRAGLEPDQEVNLHRAAAAWWEAHLDLPGAADSAIQHRLAADDPEAAARLVARQAISALRNGELFTLQGWLNRLPESAIQGDPDLPILHVMALVLAGQISEALAIIPQLESPVDNGRLGRFRTVQIWLKMLQGQVNDTDLAGEAVALTSSDPFFHNLALIALGTTLQHTDDLPGAARAFEAAYEESLRENHLFAALGGLANLVFALGDLGRLQEAKARCQQAIRHFVDRRGRHLPVAGMMFIPLAVFLFEENDLDGAEQAARQGLASIRGLFSTEVMGGDAESVLAQVAFARGDPQTAFRIIAETRQGGVEHRVSSIIERMDILEAMLNIRRGALPEARRYVEARTHQGPGAITSGAPLRQIQACLLLTEGQPAEALKLLEVQEQHIQATGRKALLVSVFIYRALALQMLNRLTEAREAVAQAVRLAAPENMQRAFIREGPAIRALLITARGESPAFVDSLLDCLPAETPSVPAAAQPARALPAQVEPLSDQETAILSLLAQGLSNQEVAERLYITVGTAKWHVHNILGKLGVSSRTQAIARARELQIIH